MRKILATTTAVAAAAAVSFGIVSVGGESVEAEATWGDTRACVTDRELSKIRIGQAKRGVHRIIDSAGRPVEKEPRWEIRKYKSCHDTWENAIHIFYVGNKVAGIDAIDHRWFRH